MFSPSPLVLIGLRYTRNFGLLTKSLNFSNPRIFMKKPEFFDKLKEAVNIFQKS